MTDMSTRHVQDRYACPDIVNYFCGTIPKNAHGKSVYEPRMHTDVLWWSEEEFVRTGITDIPFYIAIFFLKRGTFT